MLKHKPEILNSSVAGVDRHDDRIAGLLRQVGEQGDQRPASCHRASPLVGRRGRVHRVGHELERDVEALRCVARQDPFFFGVPNLQISPTPSSPRSRSVIVDAARSTFLIQLVRRPKRKASETHRLEDPVSSVHDAS